MLFIRKHSVVFYFVALLVAIQVIAPAILIPMYRLGYLNNYHAGVSLLLSVPIVMAAAIFLTKKWLKISLDMTWRPLNPIIGLYLIFLLVFLYLVQNMLDISFITALFNGRLRFFRFYFEIPIGLYQVASFVIMVFLAPLLEEILYRKIIFEKLMERYSSWTSIGITSLFFALMHLDFHGLLAYIVIAVAFTYIYFLTKNIWLNIFIHFLFNLMANSTKIQEYPIGTWDFKLGVVIYVIAIIGLIFTLTKAKSVIKNKTGLL